MSLTVEFCGEHFALSDAIGLMPLLKFAKVAKDGTKSNDMDGLAAMYDLLEQCFIPASWERFQQVATEKRADADTLLAVIPKAIEAITNRPTSRPSDSSDGPVTTSTSSAAGASVRDLFAEASAIEPRPDMAMGVLRRLSAG